MNKVILIGHVASDPELQYVGEDRKARCEFRLAVRRSYTNAQGQRDADFFQLKAWGKTAENAARFLHKGSRAACSGRLLTDSWTGKDGVKHYTTFVTADEIEFLSIAQDKQGAGSDAVSQAQAAFGAEFVQVTDDELPF